MRLIDSGAHPDLFVLARGYNRDTDKFRTDIPVDDVRRMKSFSSSVRRMETGGFALSTALTR